MDRAESVSYGDLAARATAPWTTCILLGCSTAFVPAGGKATAAGLLLASSKAVHGETPSTRGWRQCKFLPSGRYAYGQGTSVTFGNLETRTGIVGDGRYVLNGSDLTITPDSRRGVRKFRARIYDEFSGGIWLRQLALIDEGSNPPLEVRYMRVVD